MELEDCLQNKMFRGKILLDARVENQRAMVVPVVWMSKAVEDCDAYKCTNGYTNRTATPRCQKLTSSIF